MSPKVTIMSSLSPVARRDWIARLIEAVARRGERLRRDAMAEAGRRFGTRRWPAFAAYDLSLFATMCPDGAR